MLTVAFVDSSMGSVDFCIADRAGCVRRVSTGWKVAGGIHWLGPDRLIVSGARRGAPAIHILDLEGNEQSCLFRRASGGEGDCQPGRWE